jgi:hypothetical protein
MNPIYNTICAVLEEAHLITHDAASKLATHMQNNIHQSRYDDALLMVKKASGDVEKFVDEPWLGDIARLENRVAELEEKLQAKVAKKK